MIASVTPASVVVVDELDPVRVPIFTIRGAQAISAPAYSLKNIPRFDKILGVFIIFIEMAKREGFDFISIEETYGPIDVLFKAEKHDDPKLVAADLLARFRQDLTEISLLLTESEPLRKAV